MSNGFDFGGLKKPKKGEKATHPREIFRSRPSGKAKIKELWQGQAQALDKWYEDPSRNTLISMYTGAGKTLVGVLIAQSFMNQGIRNVVYACPTIDLIHQTIKEANGVGIRPTTYFESQFSDQNFAQGKSFCITTYQALLNTRNKFRGQAAPGALVLDDAHVGERLVRDSFTLRVAKKDYEETFNAIAREVRDAYEEIGKRYNFDSVFSEVGSPGILICPPTELYARGNKIESLIEAIKDSDISLQLPFDYLRGHFGSCVLTISRRLVEITPAFLPALEVGAFKDNNVPRVYLSATVQSKGDITRAFGRAPHVIEPDVDAGLGERVLLFGSALGQIASDAASINSISEEQKVLIAVPSDREATNWEDVAIPPQGAKSFSVELDKFRHAANGSFLLLGRYDGIDLPDDECRLMIVDGLPVGSSQFERYQFDKVHLDQAFFPRVANRITQLFGRINRGKNDYGIYIIASTDVENWLRNPANQAYFPRVLQEQIRL
ncbi:DEAD/DEAH box helicase [Jiella marina]|uniref:DEAD/DEAH box helicase n=1 Tax=Jiella sp. LLJ827 TaxID=2917712 RepID=UPI0021018D8A|nr:DEAD/DEAH box helicase family protein [Jiella sp. LLJ827]MCQ0989152.1 DEAD/DEAH box helicase family protein [Jiella sp. LLJ827]